ncbi:MAG: hypothetical protein ABIW76_20825 [Fibrobacteria bacterium]
MGARVSLGTMRVRGVGMPIGAAVRMRDSGGVEVFVILFGSQRRNLHGFSLFIKGIIA